MRLAILTLDMSKSLTENQKDCWSGVGKKTPFTNGITSLRWRDNPGLGHLKILWLLSSYYRFWLETAASYLYQGATAKWKSSLCLKLTQRKPVLQNHKGGIGWILSYRCSSCKRLIPIRSRIAWLQGGFWGGSSCQVIFIVSPPRICLDSASIKLCVTQKRPRAFLFSRGCQCVTTDRKPPSLTDACSAFVEQYILVIWSLLTVWSAYTTYQISLSTLRLPTRQAMVISACTVILSLSLM